MIFTDRHNRHAQCAFLHTERHNARSTHARRESELSCIKRGCTTPPSVRVFARGIYSNAGQIIGSGLAERSTRLTPRQRGGSAESQVSCRMISRLDRRINTFSPDAKSNDTERDQANNKTTPNSQPVVILHATKNTPARRCDDPVYCPISIQSSIACFDRPEVCRAHCESPARWSVNR